MALNLALLTTRAECDEVLESIEAELDGYEHRDSNLDFADREAGRTTTEVTGQLAGVNGEIAGLEATLATPNLPTKIRKATQSKLRRANDRKENLAERGEARTGASAFLADLDAEQIAAQVATLTAAQTAVTTHKATLSA